MQRPTGVKIALWTDEPRDWQPGDRREWPSMQLFRHAKRKPGNGKRPLIVIFPGGGYNVCVEAEGLAAADFYYANGFEVAMVNYRTRNHSKPVPLGRGPLWDALRALEWLEANGEGWIDRERVVLLGFSAGGHLAATVGVHGRHLPGVARLQPSALLLAYPVLRSREFGPGGSFYNLCGDADDHPDRAFFTLAPHLHAEMPPVFLWHTVNDGRVAVGPVIEFAGALGEAGVPYGLHLFPDGPHGLFMGDAAFPGTEMWPALSLRFLDYAWGITRRPGG